MHNQSNIINSRFPPCPPPGNTSRGAYLEGCEILDLVKNCLNSCIYVTTRHYGDFWLYPVSVSPGEIITGYRWDGLRWRLFDLPGEHIEGFY